MNRIKILLSTMLFTVAVAGIFAFTHKDSGKAKFATRYFKYIGSTNYTATELEKTANWVEVTSNPPSCDEFTIALCTAEIDQNQSTYITAGNALKVNVSGTLQTDVLKAAGLGTPSGIQKVPATDFTVHVNSFAP